MFSEKIAFPVSPSAFENESIDLPINCLSGSGFNKGDQDDVLG